MKLIYLGTILDPTKEHELFPKNPESFIVEIQYTEESFYPQKNQIFNNCTEVHYLWSLNYMGGPSIAFESDIQQTGFIRLIKDIEEVKINTSEHIPK